MLTLQCPYCAVWAEETELHAEGEAHLKRFGPGSEDEDFEGYLFMRENPKAAHFERWRHMHGCGQFFNAVRNTITDRFYTTYKAGEPRPDLAALLEEDK